MCLPVLCFLGKFACILLSAADVFVKINFYETSFRNTIRTSNSMNPDQSRKTLSGLDLVPNSLKKVISRGHLEAMNLCIRDKSKHMSKYTNQQITLFVTFVNSKDPDKMPHNVSVSAKIDLQRKECNIFF